MDILTWEPWLDPWRLNSPNFLFFFSFRSIYTRITINITKYNFFKPCRDVKPTECSKCREWGESS